MTLFSLSEAKGLQICCSGANCMWQAFVFGSDCETFLIFEIMQGEQKGFDLPNIRDQVDPPCDRVIWDSCVNLHKKRITFGELSQLTLEILDLRIVRRSCRASGPNSLLSNVAMARRCNKCRYYHSVCPCCVGSAAVMKKAASAKKKASTSQDEGHE